MRLRACPRSWDSLAPTAIEGIRHCESCSREVHLCTTDEQTLAHARAGDCVARLEPDRSELPRMFVGRADVVITPSQEEAQAWRRREAGIAAAIVGPFGAEDRTCPRCGYPATFRRHCYVCEAEVGEGS